MKVRTILGLVVCTVLIASAFPVFRQTPQLHAQVPFTVASVRSGRWSDSTVWSTGRVPVQGDSVLVSAGQAITYDAYSDVEIGRLQIQGTLAFARDRATRLDVGNVVVDRGGTLDMGTPGSPIPGTVTAELRLVIASGATCTGGTAFVEGDTGVWVYGRWDIQGTPVRVTWTKLTAPAAAGATMVQVADDVTDWAVGSWVVLTSTAMGSQTTARDQPQYDERQIRQVVRRSTYTELTLSAALQYAHDASGQTVGEVALLTRNAVVTSKYPGRTMQGHTMYLNGSTGSVGYAEFRDLGNFGCLGRYPVHFHLMVDTSRGMYVRGASIWRSDNNFMNIHASNGITVEDTVGYRTTGVGYFIGEPVEDGPPEMNSVDNVLIGNLSARLVYREGALRSPADSRIRASGFWIHSFNSALIGNVASGSWAMGYDDSGYHIAEQIRWRAGFALLRMVHNESHSNSGTGMFTWTNNDGINNVVDLRAWRNGHAGLKIGAYGNGIRFHRARLYENGEYNLRSSIVSTYIADSELTATPAYPTVGLFLAGYFIAPDPTQPVSVLPEHVHRTSGTRGAGSHSLHERERRGERPAQLGLCRGLSAVHGQPVQRRKSVRLWVAPELKHVVCGEQLHRDDVAAGKLPADAARSAAAGYGCGLQCGDGLVAGPVARTAHDPARRAAGDAGGRGRRRSDQRDRQRAGQCGLERGRDHPSDVLCGRTRRGDADDRAVHVQLVERRLDEALGAPVCGSDRCKRVQCVHPGDPAAAECHQFSAGSVADRDAHCGADADGHPTTDCDTHCGADRDTDCGTDRDRDSTTDRDGDSTSDGDPDGSAGTSFSAGTSTHGNPDGRTSTYRVRDV